MSLIALNAKETLMAFACFYNLPCVGSALWPTKEEGGSEKRMDVAKASERLFDIGEAFVQI